MISNFSMATLSASGVCGEKNVPVFPSITVSMAHHFPYAITGVPMLMASMGTSQKSSSGGKRNARAPAMSISFSVLYTRYFHSILDLDLALSSRNRGVSVAVQRMSFLSF